LSAQRLEVELPVRPVGDDDARRALLAHQPGQRSGVEAGDADAAIVAHPGREVGLGAEARRAGHRLADDAAQGMRVGGLDVLGIGADIADVREGEGDHLPRERRVGHDFLIAGHGGVEAQLADRFAFGAEPLPPGDSAVAKYQYARRPFGLRRRVGRIGQVGLLAAGFQRWC
jgi:hypothetical protein